VFRQGLRSAPEKKDVKRYGGTTPTILVENFRVFWHTGKKF
jgi:hypothetical protein